MFLGASPEDKASLKPPEDFIYSLPLLALDFQHSVLVYDRVLQSSAGQMVCSRREGGKGRGKGRMGAASAYSREVWCSR